MTVILNKCPGSGKEPKVLTANPCGDFKGYGLCSECDLEVSLTKLGYVFRHKPAIGERRR